jgi:hypothetical protein
MIDRYLVFGKPEQSKQNLSIALLYAELRSVLVCTGLLPAGTGHCPRAHCERRQQPVTTAAVSSVAYAWHEKLGNEAD